MRVAVITNEKHKIFAEFLNEHKSLAGLSDWNIVLSKKLKNGKDSYAEVLTDSLEKEIEIMLYSSFMKFNEKRQANILMHELVHARVSVYKEQIEKLQEDLEENLVNDITRGFERLGKLKFGDKNASNM